MPKRHRPGVSETSRLSHIEDVVLATSGEDAFELVFGIAASRIATPSRPVTAESIARVAQRHPELGITAFEKMSEESRALVSRVDALLAPTLAVTSRRQAALDAVFESLVPRLAKGDKGQFFTPRHVVELVVRLLAPRARDVVVDPACGSGAFLSQARALANVKTFGSDVDPRAVRVARLGLLAQGRALTSITRADGLRAIEGETKATIVATNPPFAGRAASDGFEVASLVRTPERDVLFLERAVNLLRPGGRLGIVLPYSKASGHAFAGLRRWLHERARIFAVVGLPRETFLPHTSQRTFVLFAKRRRRGEAPAADERAMFVVSERAGKDAAGDPVVSANGSLDHDLDDVQRVVALFLAEEGFAS